MRAELIAVGSELLLFGRQDTNGDWLAGRLARLGVGLSRRTIVGDDKEEIAEAIGAARRRSRLVVVTGGLGPTADDVTREALARSLGRTLRVDRALREALVARLAARGFRSTAAAESQAQVPEGCESIPNPVGSAPGLLHAGPPAWTVVLPGVPSEMKATFEGVLPRLRPEFPGGDPPYRRFLLAGLSESEVDERLRDLIGGGPLSRVTILATGAGVELHVLGTAADPAASGIDVDRIACEIRRRMGVWISAEGEQTLAGAVGDRLAARQATLAVAESCTGGLLGGSLTAVPGASVWFAGGFIVYSDALKRELLGVDSRLLDEHGAVSEPVALAMADGARRRTGASCALAITGIAGPEGGTDSKPVGLVFIALSQNEGIRAQRFLFGGDRGTIRARSVTRALELLRGALLGIAS